MPEYTSGLTESTTEIRRSHNDAPTNINLYQVLAKSGYASNAPAGSPGRQGERPSWKNFKQALHKSEGQWKANTEERRQVVQERAVANREHQPSIENSQQRADEGLPDLTVNRNTGGQGTVSQSQESNYWITKLPNNTDENISNKIPQKSKLKLKGLARVYGSHRAVPFALRSEEAGERFEAVDDTYNNNATPEENEEILMQRNESSFLRDSHNQIDFIVGPGHEYRSSKGVKRVTKTVDVSLPRNNEDWEAKDYNLEDQNIVSYEHQPVDNSSETTTYVEYEESEEPVAPLEAKDKEYSVQKTVQYVPVPPSTHFNERGRINHRQPRLAYNTKQYQAEERHPVQRQHQGPVTQESIDRLSQPPRRVLGDIHLHQPQAPTPWVSKSLADLKDLRQPRLAYSQKDKQYDHAQRKLEFYEKKKKERKPIDQEAIERLSKPSPRYLSYRRLEDVYQNRLEEVIQKRPESKRNKLLYGPLTKAQPRLKRNSTLEDWELHYKNSKKASAKRPTGISKKPQRSARRSYNSNGKKIDWKKKEQFYLDKIKEIRRQQLREKKLQQTLQKYKKVYDSAQHRSRSFDRRQTKKAQSRRQSRSASRSQKGRGSSSKQKGRTLQKGSKSHNSRAGLRTQISRKFSAASRSRSQSNNRNKLGTKAERGRSATRKTRPTKTPNRSTSRHRDATPHSQTLGRRKTQGSYSRTQTAKSRSRSTSRQRDPTSRSQSHGRRKFQPEPNSKTKKNSPNNISKTRLEKYSQKQQLPSIIKKPSKLLARKSSARRKPTKKIRFVTPKDKKMLGTYHYGNYYDEPPSTPRMQRSRRYANTPSRLLDHFNRSPSRSRSHREKKEEFPPYNDVWNRNVTRAKKKPVTTYRKIRLTPPGSAVRRKMSGKQNMYPEKIQRLRYDYEHRERNLDFDRELDQYRRRRYALGPSQYDDNDQNYDHYNYTGEGYTPYIGSRKQDIGRRSAISKSTRSSSRRGFSPASDMKTVVPTSQSGMNPIQGVQHGREDLMYRGRQSVVHDESPLTMSSKRTDNDGDSVAGSLPSTRSLPARVEPIKRVDFDRFDKDPRTQRSVHYPANRSMMQSSLKSLPAKAEPIGSSGLERYAKDPGTHQSVDYSANRSMMQPSPKSLPAKAEPIGSSELERYDKDPMTQRSVDYQVNRSMMQPSPRSIPAIVEPNKKTELDRFSDDPVTHRSDDHAMQQQRRNTRSSRRAREGLHQSNNNNHLDTDSIANSMSSLHLSGAKEDNLKPKGMVGWDMTGDTIKNGVGVRPMVMSTEEPYEHRAERGTSYTNDSDDTLDLDLPMARSEMSSSEAAFHVDHAKWPMHRFERNGCLACLVRASPSHIDEMKQGLRLVDRIPPEVSNRLPPLPFMDFDLDESVAISPMQLMWEHPQKKLPNMEEPIYLLLPLNRELYNENLQQVLFLYTSDLQEWRYAQGRAIRLPIENKEYDFLEVIIHDPFHYIIFDIKARFTEDVRTVPPGGGELISSMDPGVHVRIAKRSFDGPAKVKLRVEPLDMNELDLSLLIPSMNAMPACAVSPIIKISASEPSKRPLSVFVPKPGHSVYGSYKLGLMCKLQDLRSQKVYLFTKDRQIMRYQVDSALQREFANEYEFQINIRKAGGCAYAFLVLEGTQPQSGKSKGTMEDRGFLNTENLKTLVSEIEPDERKVHWLGTQLLDSNTAREIQKQQKSSDPSGVRITAFKVLRRWRNQNVKQDDGASVRRLVLIFREIGMAKEALYLQRSYKYYLLSEEGNRLGVVFEEIKACPAVLVHWKSLGQALGLPQSDLQQIDTQRRDLRKRCSAVLKKAFEQFRQEEQFYRDILIRYIRALHNIGCPRIAASIDRRHLNKFYLNEAATS